jgi:TRAP-type C4-dicarboxylate transport system substrate-binding protein
MPDKGQKSWAELEKMRQEIIAELADETQTRAARLKAESKLVEINEQLAEAFQRVCSDPTSVAYAFRNAKSSEDGGPCGTLRRGAGNLGQNI